jgi:hypothetical protein
LRELFLNECPNLEDFSAIKKLTQLKEVQVGDCPHYSASVFKELSAALPDAEIAPRFR